MVKIEVTIEIYFTIYVFTLYVDVLGNIRLTQFRKSDLLMKHQLFLEGAIDQGEAFLHLFYNSYHSALLHKFPNHSSFKKLGCFLYMPTIKRTVPR